jgi:hypothetical protein
VPQSLAKRLTWFTAVMTVLGVCAAGLCSAATGLAGVEAAAWAWVLCLLPGWTVLALEPWGRSPQQMLKLVLIGTGVRVATAAGGAAALLICRPSLPRTPFLMTLLALYLVSLAWETRALKRALPEAGRITIGSAS